MTLYRLTHAQYRLALFVLGLIETIANADDANRGEL